MSFVSIKIFFNITHLAQTLQITITTIVVGSLVLDDGKIIEQGDHQYLLTQNGKYAQLWEAQQAEAI